MLNYCKASPLKDNRTTLIDEINNEKITINASSFIRIRPIFQRKVSFKKKNDAIQYLSIYLNSIGKQVFETGSISKGHFISRKF